MIPLLDFTPFFKRLSSAALNGTGTWHIPPASGATPLLVGPTLEGVVQ